MKMTHLVVGVAALATAVGAAAYYFSKDEGEGIADVADDVVDAAKEVHGERVD